MRLPNSSTVARVAAWERSAAALMRAEHHAGATFALAMLMLVVAAAGTMTMGTKPRTVLDHVHHTDVHQISLFVLMSTS